MRTASDVLKGLHMTTVQTLIIIRHLESQKYWSENKQWVDGINQAKRFYTPGQAVTGCNREDLEFIELVEVAV